MSLTFYYGSGSPYAWKVWLALEHKQLPYAFKLLSFDKGDTRTPEFLALNPRGKVPVLVDDGVALSESSAIVEYLEERWPERPLIPGTPAERANIRRLAAEADAYFPQAMHALRPFITGAAGATPEALTSGRDGVVAELGRFASYLGAQEFLAGPLTLADFALYPHVRLLLRFNSRIAGLDIEPAVPAGLRRWLDRITALPYLERTIPPHWKA